MDRCGRAWKGRLLGGGEEVCDVLLSGAVGGVAVCDVAKKSELHSPRASFQA
jgi:hypothetical protein